MQLVETILQNNTKFCYWDKDSSHSEKICLEYFVLCARFH